MTDVASMELGQDQVVACSRRLGLLRAGMGTGGSGPGALIVSNENDIWYLTGFVGHSALLLVTATRAVIICDRRYEEVLEAWAQCELFEVVMGARHQLGREIHRLAGEEGLDTLGIQAEAMTIEFRDALAGSLDGIELASTNGLVATLRRCKDDHEIGLIERAIAIQELALEATLASLEAGQTEAQVYARLEFEMRMAGASGASFEPIIGSGPNSSVIHHLPGDRPISDGMLLVDWGARVEGYCSDLTRTFSLGPMPAEMQQVYDIVLEALEAAIDAW